MPPGFTDMHGAAKLWGLSVAQARRLCWQRRVKAWKIGGAWMISHAEIKKYQEARKRPGQYVRERFKRDYNKPIEWRKV